MKKIGIISFIILLAVFLIYIGLTGKNVEENDNKIKIYTSVFPLYETARKIAGDKLEIGLVVPNGAEAHEYEPSPRKIAELEGADIFFYIGIGMEPWAVKASSIMKESGVKVVELSKYLDLIKLENSHETENARPQYDPHVWLDPINMRRIAEIISKELAEIDPGNREIYSNNYQIYSGKIADLDTEYRNSLNDKDKDIIIVSHAAFGYLARRYNFKQLAISGISSHGEASPGNIAELVKTAREKKLNYVFMETMTDKRVVQVLADEADLKILKLNPFIGLTEKEMKNGEDYFSIMHRNLDNLRKALVNSNG